MFIETSIPLPVGAEARIDLLVQEGQISADVVVRHIKPACGMGLNFTAMLEDDRPRLGMLIRRLRDSSGDSQLQVNKGLRWEAHGKR